MYEPITERSVVQQLDDLPAKAVVVDRGGDAWQKRDGDWVVAIGPADEGWSDDDPYSNSRYVATWGPLYLVYNPDHHR